MTLHIPVKFVLFVLYTLALLGGAFGISYAVFEWRDEDAVSESTIQQLDSLDGRIDSLSTRISGLSSGSGDSSACHAALLGV